MIPEKEKEILEEIKFSDKILRIRSEFSQEKGDAFWIFKKEDILQVFKELGYFPKYLKGGGIFYQENVMNIFLNTILSLVKIILKFIYLSIKIMF